LVLQACGGGSGDSAPTFTLTVKVAGATVASVPSGQTINVAAKVGDSIEVDCDTSVAWTLLAGGSISTGYADTTIFDGVSIQETTTAQVSKIWTANTSGSPPPASPAVFSVVTGTAPGNNATVIFRLVT